ncbi:protease inhibitor I42 family protein [Rosenbergiella australiborealis]|uniref:protease inhibitor I42 family protein n=1 Tax=Rosenbergiella australiborealis TaxID=1544696 RepID=UPI001F4DC38A|nr:protease inhibitor I42 family protein [Rosenbergiella australiborealis]
MNRYTMIIAGIAMLLSLPALATDQKQRLEGVEGQLVQLVVASHPTTGYQWMIKQLPKQLIFISADHQHPENCPKGAVGCPTQQTFTFIAQQKGSADLQLIYGRSFDKASWKVETVAVTIK